MFVAVCKCFLDILSCLGRCFQEDEFVLSERHGFLFGDGSLVLQIQFVTDQHDDHILTAFSRASVSHLSTWLNVSRRYVVNQ